MVEFLILVGLFLKLRVKLHNLELSYEVCDFMMLILYKRSPLLNFLFFLLFIKLIID